MKKIESVINHVGTAAPGCPVEQRLTELRDGRIRGLREGLRQMTARLKSFPEILAATLREIFDESAYKRFLDEKQWASSRAAYAAFRQEYEVTKARRPRCC